MSYMPERLHLIRVAFLILMFRNSLRLYNFEGVDGGFVLESIQILLFIVAITLFESSFEVSRENYILGSLLALFTSIGGGLAVIDHKPESSENIIKLGVFSVIFYIFLRNFMNATSRVLTFLLK